MSTFQKLYKKLKSFVAILVFTINVLVILSVLGWKFCLNIHGILNKFLLWIIKYRLDKGSQRAANRPPGGDFS